MMINREIGIYLEGKRIGAIHARDIPKAGTKIIFEDTEYEVDGPVHVVGDTAGNEAIAIKDTRIKSVRMF